jgi:REP element-mobilizing transposase RayT
MEKIIAILAHKNMTNYNPHIHHRRSIRLKGYDYSREGLYFVSICVQNRESLFGKVKDGELILNDAGRMVIKWYYELQHKFQDIKCGDMVVMPNHFHCIIQNVGTPSVTPIAPAAAVVGANLCVRPDENPGLPKHIITDESKHVITDESKHVISDECKNDVMGFFQNYNPVITDCKNPVITDNKNIMGEHENNNKGEHIGSPLRAIVQWFKTMTTNEYIRGVKTLGWEPFNGKLWQRNYHEHIIRNEQSYHTISGYILNNPAKWVDDKFYML